MECKTGVRRIFGAFSRLDMSLYSLKALQRYGTPVYTKHAHCASCLLPAYMLLNEHWQGEQIELFFLFCPIQKDKLGYANTHAAFPLPHHLPIPTMKTKSCDKRRCQMCIWWTHHCAMHTKQLLHYALTLPRASLSVFVCLFVSCVRVCVCWPCGSSGQQTWFVWRCLWLLFRAASSSPGCNRTTLLGWRTPSLSRSYRDSQTLHRTQDTGHMYTMA